MKKLKDELKYGKKGITLISLVVTIIVLLILAGVTIAILTVDNGILTRAQEAKNKTEEAQENEQDILNEYETLLNEYAGIDWDTALANATKHPDQTTSTAIGVGTDGKTVNMDLWYYSLDINTNGYGLNSPEVLNNSENGGTNTQKIIGAGYRGGISKNGTIEGKIPQYIKEDNGEWIKVTSLYRTFEGIDLKESPEIPSTIIKMNCTFEKCSYLKSMPIIPNSIETMRWTFNTCTDLEQISTIPHSVYDLTGTFAGCSLLKTAPLIPDNVTICTYTFMNCPNLSGKLIINANLSGKNVSDNVTDWYSILWESATNEDCHLKLYGTCSELEKIASAYHQINANIELGD